jgi:hypothetical protein
MILLDNKKDVSFNKVTRLFREEDISLLTIRTTLLTSLYNEINRE